MDKNILEGLLADLKEDVEQFADNFKDDPASTSEWGHYYFCSEDGARLIYDRNLPKTHKCSLCSKEYVDEKFDKVWTYFYRNDAFLVLYKAAVLYKFTKEDKYIQIIKKITTFYADNYLKFKIHARDEVLEVTGTGKLGYARVMPQELNESIIAVRLVMALQLVKEEIGQEFIDYVHQNLARPIYDILKPQINRIHNIPFWADASIGAMGIIFNDQEMLDFALNGEFGYRRQLKEGVSADGLWHEGSIHYNYFILEGIILFRLVALNTNLALKEEDEIIKKMLIAGFNFAFSNYDYPNPNDGWPNLNLRTYDFIYHIAAHIYPDKIFKEILKTITSSTIERGSVPLSENYYYQNKYSLEELLYSKEINFDNYKILPLKPYTYPSSCFAMLRNEHFNVFIKYGHNTRSHAHPDKMNIEVMIDQYLFAHDLSNTGYGAKICSEWHRTSVAHNTVVINGQNHQDLTGRGEVEAYSPHHFKGVSNPYQDVKFTREITLSNNKLFDQFNVDAKESVTSDYVFHTRAQLLSTPKTKKGTLEYNENGYQHLKQVKEIVEEGDINLVFKVGTKEVVMKISRKNNEKVFIADSLDNPINKTQTAIIVRSKGENITYNVEFSLRNKLILKGVGKTYPNGAIAVKDFNLEATDGEFIVFVGPSGCGKTTTLRMIAGLEDITEGEIYLGNRLLNDVSPSERDIAMVFQSYALYPHMSIYKNLAFGLSLRHIDKSEIRNRVKQVAATLGLMSQLKKFPRELSGGQRQRVALGRAIVRHAKVFLMDEPLSNLDAKLRTDMRKEIIKIHQRVGAITVYVTHDQIEAMTMATKIVVMSNGLVQQIGSPLELYTNPVNVFVATFIGSPMMNILEGVYQDGVFTTSNNIKIEINEKDRKTLQPYQGKEVLLGVRPEEVIYSEDEGDPLTITGVENLGNECIVHTMIGDKRFTLRLLHGLMLKIGQQIKFKVNNEKLHFFDKDSEMAIV